MKYATLVRPETLLGWHRKFVALKYTAKRRIQTANQKRREIIRDLCVKFATENIGWGYGRIQGALTNIGYAKSFVSSIKRECLNRMIFIGGNSLRKAIFHYLEHYHSERDHQGLENVIPFPQSASVGDSNGLIVKNERLGGLLNYYYRIPDEENSQEVQKAA